MASIASVPGHGASIEKHRCRHRSRALADHTWTDGTQHSQDVVLQLPAQVFIFFQKCWGGTRLLAQFITGHGGFTVSFEQIGYRKEVCIGNLFPMSWQAHHHPGSTDLLEVHFTPPKGKAERSLLEHDFISKLPGYFACPTHISNRRAPSPRRAGPRFLDGPAARATTARPRWSSRRSNRNRLVLRVNALSIASSVEIEGADGRQHSDEGSGSYPFRSGAFSHQYHNPSP